MCRWDSTKELVECPNCGDAVQDDGRCSMCGIAPVDPEEDRHLVVFLGDTHCGSTVGLCPEEGLELDDGGWYQPNKAQHWLWANWLDA